MTVSFRGQERTLAQMAPFLEADRSRRAPGAPGSFRRPAGGLQDKDVLDDLFDKMMELRIAVGREAGFSNFVEYRVQESRAVRLRHRRFDPISQRGRKSRRAAHAEDSGGTQGSDRARNVPTLGLARSTRWAGRRFIRSATSSSSRPETETIFSEVDAELGAQFAYLRPEPTARSGQSQGKGAGRLSDDARRRTASRSFS